MYSCASTLSVDRRATSDYESHDVPAVADRNLRSYNNNCSEADGILSAMDTKVINREAASSSKGFRLQKLRAAKLMLDTIIREPKSLFYTAIESVEDVFHCTISSDGAIDYYEEDKNYSDAGSFTLFSEPVLNTLVSFFDIYIVRWQQSDGVRLGFYSTRKIGKERKKAVVNGAPVYLPEEPILSLLQAGRKLSDEVIDTIKDALIGEYLRQYGEKPTGGYINALKSLSREDLQRFLSHITWFFDEENEIELKQTVLRMIEESPFHNVSHVGKEKNICASLLEAIEERQTSKTLLGKVLSASDIQMIFKEAESAPTSLGKDPVWRQLEQLERDAEDKRNLEDKFIAVVANYPRRNLEFLARKACRSKTEQSSADRSFKSLKYRVWEACSEYLYALSYQPPTTAEQINEHISELVIRANESIGELSQDYYYKISNSVTVEGIILDLFDTCLLAFDEVRNDDQ